MKYLALLFCLASAIAQAQIGYQVTLLNTATGEPRANETVTVTVEITNSAGGVVCSETKSATTNDFGILSVAVGNSDTFAETDWSKLPFFISATVDGVMIGKSQLLSVPVAEHAKHTGELTREMLNGRTFRAKDVGRITASISFTIYGFTYTQHYDSIEMENPVYTGDYVILGNTVICSYTSEWGDPYSLIFVYYNGKLAGDNFTWI